LPAKATHVLDYVWRAVRLTGREYGMTIGF